MSQLTQCLSEIEYLSERYDLDFQKTFNAFRDFFAHDGRTVPIDLKPLFNILNIIPVGTSECERGFSQMNLIETDLRNSLNVSSIADLLFIKLNGPPLESWQPKSYVVHWLRNHNNADIAANRCKEVTEQVSEDDKAFYNILT